jgi:two-component system OmpR family sensor kinase
MKIRYRISLWFIGGGLLSTLLLSLFVVYEKATLPYELIDDELLSQVNSIADFLRENRSDAEVASVLKSLSRPYWIQLFDHKNEVIFSSDLVALVDIPLKQAPSFYNVNTQAPLGQFFTGADSEEKAQFRVHFAQFDDGGSPVMLYIARPLEDLTRETSELIQSIFIGLAISSLCLLAMSYAIAGRILRPIKTINRLVREISENTLDKRIAPAKSRDELHELTVSLNTMFDRLEFSFARQKEFVANASHELKTPLSILRLAMEEAIGDNSIAEPLRKKLSDQYIILLRLNRLVENLLNLSVLEFKGSVKTDRFSLNDLAMEVVEEFRPIAEAHHMTLTVSFNDRCMMSGSRDLIRQIFINLSDNAIKYNKPGGTIRYRITADKGYATVKISDTGIGIPADSIVRVFEQFYRVEKSRAARHGGSGLGLTIVKKIVELHNGTISAESVPGQWTAITFTLPILS